MGADTDNMPGGLESISSTFKHSRPPGRSNAVRWIRVLSGLLSNNNDDWRNFEHCLARTFPEPIDLDGVSLAASI